jgi:hypothetical protein
MFFIFRFSNFHSTDLDIIRWALLMTALFCWKNFFQSLLSGRIMNIVARREPRKLTLKNAAMIFFKQTVVQLSGLLLVVFAAAFPFSSWILFPVLLVLPALLYTAGVINAIEPERAFRSFLKKTSLHISYDFMKMLAAMLIIIVGILILTVNVAAIIFFIPFVLKSFWGVDTEFTIAGAMSASLFFNTTLWSIIFCLVWLIIDPFCRIVYVLRVFYFESIGKGWDIQAALNRISATAAKAVVIFILLTTPLMLSAETGKASPASRENRISAVQLEKQIDKTLDNLEFQWRSPHKVSREESWIKYYIMKALEYCMKTLESIIEYIVDFFRSKSKSSSSSSGSGIGALFLGLLNILKFLIPALLIAIIAVIAWRKFRNRGKTGNTKLVSSERRPDLTRKDITANELEEQEWLKLSSELLEKGEFKLSLRALYLACISALAQRKLLLVRRYKTDYEYLNELRRRAHAMPQLIPVFENNVSIFQRVWYGDYPADRTMIEQYLERSKILFPEKQPEKPENQGAPDAEK